MFRKSAEAPPSPKLNAYGIFGDISPKTAYNLILKYEVFFVNTSILFASPAQLYKLRGGEVLSW